MRSQRIETRAGGSGKTTAVTFLCIALTVITLAGCGYQKALRPRLGAPKRVEGGMLFQYYAPSAIRVNLAGEFNQWSDTANGRPIDIKMDPMELGDDGIWRLVKSLDPGTYQYKFIIDGTSWAHDPNNLDTTDDGYGGFNSVLVVKDPRRE